MRSLSEHNVTPNFWGFNFRFVWFSGCLQKKFLKKLKKRIYRNKAHFCSLHMLLDWCRKNEGNPFSTKIWVVGSYTDTLLSPEIWSICEDPISVLHCHGYSNPQSEWIILLYIHVPYKTSLRSFYSDHRYPSLADIIFILLYYSTLPNKNLSFLDGSLQFWRTEFWNFM